jgi:hypothetical protein
MRPSRPFTFLCSSWKSARFLSRDLRAAVSRALVLLRAVLAAVTAVLASRVMISIAFS